MQISAGMSGNPCISVMHYGPYVCVEAKGCITGEGGLSMIDARVISLLYTAGGVHIVQNYRKIHDVLLQWLKREQDFTTIRTISRTN